MEQEEIVARIEANRGYFGDAFTDAILAIVTVAFEKKGTD